MLLCRLAYGFIMQLSLLIKAVAVCSCVARSYPTNSTDRETDTLVTFDLLCSDDPLGYLCRHACSCSQNQGRLLCPQYIPGSADESGNEVPGTHCSSDKSASLELSVAHAHSFIRKSEA